MKFVPKRTALFNLPVDVICYLALRYLDYPSAINLFEVIILKNFTLQKALAALENRNLDITNYVSSFYSKERSQVYKELTKTRKIVAGDNSSFYFCPRKGWHVWGHDVNTFSKPISNSTPQKLVVSPKTANGYPYQWWSKSKLKIIDLVNSNSRVFFLTAEGKVYRNGKDFALTSNTVFDFELIKELADKKVIKIALGYEHVLVLTDEGQVYSWGHNLFGQLGLGDDSYRSTPQLIQAFNKIKITDIFAGEHVSFCLSAEGKAYAFGINQSGQLGLGMEIGKQLNPLLIPTLQNEKIVSIACRIFHTLFLNATGEVYSSGTSFGGALGLGAITCSVNTPTLITSLATQKIKKIATGSNYSMCLSEQGEVYAFGSNTTSNQLGLSNEQMKGDNLCTIPLPLLLPENDTITEVAAGEHHTLCLTKTGKIYSFGLNSYGQLGHSHTDWKLPQKVSIPTYSTANSSLPSQSQP